MGEPLDRIVQRTGPRRTVEHRRVRVAHRSPSRHRRLEDRIQHLASPQQPGWSHPRRVRCHLDPQNPQTTPITGGPTTGVPSVRSRPLPLFDHAGHIKKSTRPAAVPLSHRCSASRTLRSSQRFGSRSCSGEKLAARSRPSDHPVCVILLRQASSWVTCSHTLTTPNGSEGLGVVLLASYLFG